MEFNITLQSVTNSAVELKRKHLGLNFLDQARTDTRKSLDTDLIKNFCPDVRLDPTIRIHEQVARESGLFAENDSVTIETGPRTLNRFVEIETIIQKNAAGEITSVSPKYKINHGKIIDWWRKEGFPTKILS